MGELEQSDVAQRASRGPYIALATKMQAACKCSESFRIANWRGVRRRLPWIPSMRSQIPDQDGEGRDMAYPPDDVTNYALLRPAA